MTEFGDQEFEQFMDDEKSKTAPFFLILTIREKAKTIAELLKIANDLYTSFENNRTSDSKHKELQDYIYKLLQSSLETIDQFDYIVMDQLGTDEESEDDDRDDRKN